MYQFSPHHAITPILLEMHVTLGYYDGVCYEVVNLITVGGYIMQKVNTGKTGRTILVVVAFLASFIFLKPARAQDTSNPAPCPKPYIKLIKPKLAQPGQEIIIRGRRFGEDEASGDVIFPPGLSTARIIYWRNNRIKVVVPPGAQTGEIVVKTKCATSNGEFLKVGNETSKGELGGKKKPALE